MSKREEVQEKGVRSIRSSNYTGIADISPRVGKSKILIDSIRDKSDWNIVISSPFRSIQDNWVGEFSKWGLGYEPESICSRSLGSISSGLDLLVIDEIQTLSDNQIQVIKSKAPKRILGLTGTVSDDTVDKLRLELGLDIIFSYSIERAISDGIISNFEVILVECDFDNAVKNVLAGTKKKPFYTTELRNYVSLHANFEKYRKLAWGDPYYQRVKDMYMMKRYNFIYTAQSKLDVAKKIVDSTDRCIVFTTRREQAEYLCEHSFHSKNKKKDNLTKFVGEEIDKLSVIEMVNMGITIPNLKTAIIHQMRSNSEMTLQKVLRVCNLEDDKVARIYVTMYKNSVDENWTERAFEGVDNSRIRRVRASEIWKV